MIKKLIAILTLATSSVYADQTLTAQAWLVADHNGKYSKDLICQRFAVSQVSLN